MRFPPPLTRGTRALVLAIAEKLRTLPPVTVYEPEYVKPLAQAGSVDEVQIQHYDEDLWVVSGGWLERLLNDINFDDYESGCTLTGSCASPGLFTRLEELGIRDGDTVSIYDLEFEYTR